MVRQLNTQPFPYWTFYDGRFLFSNFVIPLLKSTCAALLYSALRQISRRRYNHKAANCSSYSRSVPLFHLADPPDGAMPVAQEDPSTQLPSTNHHPVFFTTTTTSTSTSSSTYISLTSAEAGGPPGAPAALAASAKEAAAHEAGGGRGGPGGHSLASTEVVIAALDVDTHKQLSHSHLGRFAPSLFYQG